MVTKLFKNGLLKIQWSDGTKATKVDATIMRARARDACPAAGQAAGRPRALAAERALCGQN